MNAMSKQAVKMYRDLAKERVRGIRDLWYFVTDLERNPLLVVNAWGDNIEMFVNDPWNHVRASTCSSIPYGASVGDIRMQALDDASFDFDLDRESIMLVSMNGKVLCK